jgi:hypothetical protein
VDHALRAISMQANIDAGNIDMGHIDMGDMGQECDTGALNARASASSFMLDKGAR